MLNFWSKGSFLTLSCIYHYFAKGDWGFLLLLGSVIQFAVGVLNHTQRRGDGSVCHSCRRNVIVVSKRVAGRSVLACAPAQVNISSVWQVQTWGPRRLAISTHGLAACHTHTCIQYIQSGALEIQYLTKKMLPSSDFLSTVSLECFMSW